MLLRNTLVAILILPCCHSTSDPKDNPHQEHQNEKQEVPGEPLTSHDFKNAEKIGHVDPGLSTEDPIEKAGLFEGDIEIQNPGNDPTQVSPEKNAVADPSKKWANGVVPYLISSRFDEHDRSVIARAILEFHRQTCVSFKARNSESDYIMFVKGDGCSSSVGKVGGGAQYVTLGEGCIYPGIVMHELMHAIGFWHEQSRWDRDEHVAVLYENIQPGMEENFRKVSRSEAQNLSVPYDTSSVMHYGPYAFSKNRQKQYKTIIPKIQNERMGQRGNFSEMDVLKINKLYNCYKRPEGNNSTTSTTTTTTSRPTSTPASSSGSPECTDKNKHCSTWAANEECEKNPDWMLANCKRSCNQCRTCSNKNGNCDAWASKGECSKNPEYMNKNCPLACKRC